MSDFADVEQFARQHAACGGITPNATAQLGGGYLLTLTCACGAAHDRWVTAEEARQGPSLGPPPGVAPPAPAGAAPPAPPPPPRATPSREVEEALRAALESEEAAAARPAAPPKPRPVVDSAGVGAGPPKPTPSRELQDVVKALQAETAGRKAVAAPSRAADARLRLDSAGPRALATPKGRGAAATPGRGSTRRFWLGLLVALLAVSAVVAYVGMEQLQESVTVGVATGPTPSAAPAPAEDERAALTEALQGLRQLQAVSGPVDYSLYSSRVFFAKSDVERYLRAPGAGDARTAVRELMDIHLLATAAWRARALNEKEAWEAVGRDPALNACPRARRVVDFAEQPVARSGAHSRGIAVASAIPLLWECAAEKFTALERAVAAR